MVTPVFPRASHPLSRSHWRVFAYVAVSFIVGCVCAPRAFAATAYPKVKTGPVFSPYKYVPSNFNVRRGQLRTRVGERVFPVVGAESLIGTVVPGLRVLTLAFAHGSCGNETWGALHGKGEVPTRDVVNTVIPALVKHNVDYIVSTGGEGATFTCPRTASFVKFVKKYASKNLIGIDFDIENKQTRAETTALIRDAVYAQTVFPELNFSFTIATFAGDDGSHNGVNALGARIIHEIREYGLLHYTIDLMVMDYDKITPHKCVVVSGFCDMGQSAIQAVYNLQFVYHVPADRIEVTPLLMFNDEHNFFTLQDMSTVLAFAKSEGLAGVHFWSLDGDSGCRATETLFFSHKRIDWGDYGRGARQQCDTSSGAPPLAYTRLALKAFGAGE